MSDWLTEEMNRQARAGIPLVDNANDRLWGPNGQYDGPRCAAVDCRTPVDNDGEWCEDCSDVPHQFTPEGGHRLASWCACGRINAASIHQDERPTRDAMTVPPFEYDRTDRVWL